MCKKRFVLSLFPHRIYVLASCEAILRYPNQVFLEILKAPYSSKIYILLSKKGLIN